MDTKRIDQLNGRRRIMIIVIVMQVDSFSLFISSLLKVIRSCQRVKWSIGSLFDVKILLLTAHPMPNSNLFGK